MTILADLHESPRSFDYLADKYGSHIEYFLRKLIKRGAVVKIPKGEGHLYGVPAPPMRDEPLPKESPRLTAKCKVCRVAIYDNRVFCSRECHALHMKRKVRTIYMKCRKCKQMKRPDQFPANCRGYDKSICYRCRRQLRATA